ncbi:MAG: hypothetical protein WCF48_06985, partial [Terriglobales bacterium]
MKLRSQRRARLLGLFALLTALLLTARPGYAEPLPFERAVRLALAHSTGSAIAGANVQRAFASYR